MDVLSEIASVKKPVENLIPSLLTTYELIGLSKRFTVSGKSDRGITLQGKNISIALRVEFGSKRDFFETLTYLNSTPANYKVLVVSSNSRSLPMEAAYTVLKKKLQVKDRWLLLDVEGKKEPMRINYGGRPRSEMLDSRPRRTDSWSDSQPQRTDSYSTEEPRLNKNTGKPVRRKMIYGRGYRKEQD